MNNKQLEEHIKRINKIHTREELTVSIPVQESRVGQTASVKVNAISKGIDWDNSTLFISPEKPLQLANRHELYQDDLDRLDEYKQNNIMMGIYEEERIREVNQVKDLLSKTDIKKLTTNQLKDLKKILEFEPQ